MWFNKFTLALGVAAAGFAFGSPDSEKDPATGLVIDENWELVRAHCIACHSTMAITQSMKDEKGWVSTVKKMQFQQGLYPLGEAEAGIVAYLVENYNVPERPYNPKIRAPLED